MISISRVARVASAMLAFSCLTVAAAAAAPSSGYEFASPAFAIESKGAKALPDGKIPGLPVSKPALAFAKLGQGYVGETEPNGTVATATPLPGTRAVVRGNIFPATDVDFYSFTANAGDRVYAATMTSFSSGNSTDSQLTLLDTDGTTVIEFDDDSGTMAALSSVIAGAVIPSTGTYFIKVNDFTAATGIEKGYDLHFRLQSGAPTPEVEPNDAPISAMPLPANGWVSGARDPATATEQDWYSFTLNAGDTVYLALDLDPEDDLVVWNGRLGVALFGDANNQILPADDAGTSDTGSTPPTTNRPAEALFMTAKTAGTYFAFVDSASAATGGPTATYHLSVTVHPATNEGINCTTYTSTDVPKTIGPGNTLVSSTITVPGNPRIADLDVDIELNHVFMTEIDAQLRSPSGNDNGLFTDIGANALGGQTQMSTVFDDEAGTIPFYTALRGVQVKPEAAYRLDWFDGENAGGTWTLDLRDDVSNANGGTLTGWSLRICEAPPPPACPSGFATTTVYATDFESGAAGFTHSGTLDEWELGLPATLATGTSNPPPVAAFDTCHSGVNCWKTDLDGTYELGSSQDLLSPAINLAGLSPPIVVNWAMRYQMENANFDHMSVDAQQVGGATPIRLFEWLGPTMTNAAGNPAVNIGASAGWATHSARADSLAGLNSELRFHLDSDNTVNLAGLAIDDVSVTGCRALESDLSITKSDGVDDAVPGEQVIYTITARNDGPDPVTGATVTDTFPLALTCNTTCLPTGGGTCSGGTIVGNLADSVSLPVGATVAYTAVCDIAPSATGTLVNTATISHPQDADGTGGDNSATDTDTLVPTADLSITKDDGLTEVVPGTQTTYTIVASNAGPSDVAGATVSDTFAPSLSCTWVCSTTGGGTCSAGPITGNINDVANLPAGSVLTYTATCDVAADATGTLANTADIAAPGGITDPASADNTDTDSTDLTPQSDLTLSVVETPDPVVAGGSLTYAATVANAGPSVATTVSYELPLPAGTTFAAFTASPPFSCTTPAVGVNGTVVCTAASLAPSGSHTIDVVVDVATDATGPLVATALVTSGTTDPATGDNTSTPSTSVVIETDLAISIDNMRNGVSVGETVVYSVQVDNLGPSDANDAQLDITLSGTLADVEWTCVPSPDAPCPATSGSGNVGETVDIGAGEGLLFDVVGTVAPQDGDPASISGSASIEAAAGSSDPDPSNNTATDTDPILPFGIFSDGFES